MNGGKKGAKVEGSSMLSLGLLQRTDKCVEGNRQKTLLKCKSVFSKVWKQ